MQEMCQLELSVHPLSSVVDVHGSEPFGDIKVALKRGAVDWLNVVPSTTWFALDRVLTRMLKLCRVAHRKGIWWSVQIETNPLWSCSGVECLLQLEGGQACGNDRWACVHQCALLG